MFSIYSENCSSVRNYKTLRKVQSSILFVKEHKSYFSYDDFDQQIIFKDRYSPIFDMNSWGVNI